MTGDKGMDNEHGLRAISDQMLAMIDRLREIERSKQDVPMGSDDFVERAREAEHLGRLVFRWAGIQLQAAEASVSAVQRGDLPALPLLEVSPRRLDRILASWREAQLRFEIATPGSPEAEAAADAVERLREEFQAAREMKMAQGRSEGAR